MRLANAPRGGISGRGTVRSCQYCTSLRRLDPDKAAQAIALCRKACDGGDKPACADTKVEP